MGFMSIVETIGKTVEVAGVAVIVIGIVYAAARHSAELFGREPHKGFREIRQAVARSILLGLEVLIAGDIIRTVAVEPTFRSLGVLALIVAIRTFISVELELEISGRWPWQQRTPSD